MLGFFGFLDKPRISKEKVAQKELMEEKTACANRLVEYHYYESKHTFIISITYFLAFDLKKMCLPNPDGSVTENIASFSIEERYPHALEDEFDFLDEQLVIMKLYWDWKARRISLK